MKEPYGKAVAPHNGEVYSIAGWLDVYDPNTDTWTDGPSMPTPRAQFATAVVGSNIYAIGGVDSSFAYSDVVEYFDIGDQTWHSDRSLPVSLAGCRGVAIGNAIYVSGGLTSPTVPVDTVYRAEVPEPATLSLLALGGLTVLQRRRKR